MGEVYAMFHVFIGIPMDYGAIRVLFKKDL